MWEINVGKKRNTLNPKYLHKLRKSKSVRLCRALPYNSITSVYDNVAYYRCDSRLQKMI